MTHDQNTSKIIYFQIVYTIANLQNAWITEKQNKQENI